MNKRIKKKQRRLKNKKLCEHYPFLTLRHYNDKPFTEYDFTELDMMEDGWRKAFGTQMLEEIRTAALKTNSLDTIRVIQIKEKFGGLRFYMDAPREIQDIINKYEKLSYSYCMFCGAHAHERNDGYWIYTLCDKCMERLNRR